MNALFVIMILRMKRCYVVRCVLSAHTQRLNMMRIITLSFFTNQFSIIRIHILFVPWPLSTIFLFPFLYEFFLLIIKFLPLPAILVWFYFLQLCIS